MFCFVSFFFRFFLSFNQFFCLFTPFSFLVLPFHPSKREREVLRERERDTCRNDRNDGGKVYFVVETEMLALESPWHSRIL